MNNRASLVRSVLQRLAIAFVALAGIAAQASTITYFHNDLAGSPVAATNSSGQVIWRESYRPYGERLTNSAAAASNDVWFTSRRQDADTGLVYMGARYYDPVIGRFISTDPKLFDEQNTQLFNRYTYANNNPYRYKDPDGRTPVDIGFALWDGGHFLGAAAAWAVGSATGNTVLAATGKEGMRESALDAGVSVGAIALPISSGMIKGVLRTAEEAADFAKLSKRLASEAQMGEEGIAIAGAGTNRTLRTADRISAEHGGRAEDWAKKSSSAFTIEDGRKFETHWLENTRTGERVEFKTNLIE